MEKKRKQVDLRCYYCGRPASVPAGFIALGRDDLFAKTGRWEVAYIAKKGTGKTGPVGERLSCPYCCRPIDGGAS